MNARSTFLSAALLALGCARGSQADLSVSARAATASSSSPTTTSAPASSLDVGNGISVDRVRVVVRRLRLEGTTASADGGAAGVIRTSAAHGSDDGSDAGSGGSGSDDLDESVLGPLLADLPASTIAGGLQQIFQGTVPAGTYRELKIAIGPVGPDQAGTDAGLQQMATRQASIIIGGQVNGAAFEFVSGLTAEIDLEGQIVVSADKGNNITLSVDPGLWFAGAGGAPLDPTQAGNRSAIEDNIKRSIKAFQDDDRSGGDDHGGGGDDGPGHH